MVSAQPNAIVAGQELFTTTDPETGKVLEWKVDKDQSIEGRYPVFVAEVENMKYTAEVRTVFISAEQTKKTIPSEQKEMNKVIESRPGGEKAISKESREIADEDKHSRKK